MQTSNTQRWGLKVIPEAIPLQLKELHRWIVWKAEIRKDKITKIPIQAKPSCRKASTKDLSHWKDFETALSIYNQHIKLSGIGFVLTQEAGIKNTGFFGVDIDSCIKNNKISLKAQNIVDTLSSYWEISPSGKGLRCFGKGKLPGKSFNNQKHKIEMYNGDSARFLTVTGHRLADTSMGVNEVGLDYIESIYSKYSTSENDSVIVSYDTKMPSLDENIQVNIVNLNDHHRDFLKFGAVSNQYASRSEALLAVIMALYSCCSLGDSHVFNLLVNEQITHDIALDHRQQNSEKAIAYLWQQCIVAKSKLNKPISPKEFDVKNTKLSFKQTLINRYVYITNLDKYYDTVSGLFLTKQAFSVKYKHEIYSAHNFLSLNKTTRKMDSLIYCPGCVKKEIVWNRKKCLNIWQPPQLALPKNVIDADIKLWLDHAQYLIVNNFERQHFLDWMAFTLQHQNIKINHGILFAGTTRIGKDTMIHPLIEGLGEDNVSQPSADELKEHFTEYLHHKKLIVFQEIKNFEKVEIENKLKPMLAAPPKVLTIRLFGKGFYDTPNIVCVIFMSNYCNSLKISKGDGRYFAIWCDVIKKEDTYYQALWAWLDSKIASITFRNF